MNHEVYLVVLLAASLVSYAVGYVTAQRPWARRRVRRYKPLPWQQNFERLPNGVLRRHRSTTPPPPPPLPRRGHRDAA